MKLFVVLFIGAIATTALASIVIPYDHAKPPAMPLPIAYGKAMDALGSATNQFHCLNASIDTYFDSDGGWQFTFYSTNAKPRWVTVEPKGKVHIEDMMIR